MAVEKIPAVEVETVVKSNIDPLQDMLANMDDDGVIKKGTGDKPDAVIDEKSKTPSPDDTGTGDKPDADVVTSEGGDKPAKPLGDKKPELYAGKYNNLEDFKRGVDEVVKALNLPDAMKKRFIQPLIDAEDWKGLSDTYLDMQTEYESKKKLEPDIETVDKTGTDEGTQIDLTVEDRAKVDEVVVRELYHSDIYREMKEAGITFGDDGHVFPQNGQELRQLKIDYPAFYRDFIDTINETRNTVLEVKKVLDKRDSMIEQSKTEGTQFINDFNKKHSLGLKETDVKEMVDNFMKMPEAFQDNKGVMVPKKDAIKKLFYAERMPELLDKITISAESRGRKQHADDKDKIDKKIIETASTSGKRPATREKVAEGTDKDTPENIRKKTPERIQQELDEIVSKLE